jgi:hypothetical protein
MSGRFWALNDTMILLEPCVGSISGEPRARRHNGSTNLLEIVTGFGADASAVGDIEAMATLTAPTSAAAADGANSMDHPAARTASPSPAQSGAPVEAVRTSTGVTH